MSIPKVELPEEVVEELHRRLRFAQESLSDLRDILKQTASAFVTHLPRGVFSNLRTIEDNLYFCTNEIEEYIDVEEN